CNGCNFLPFGHITRAYRRVDMHVLLVHDAPVGQRMLDEHFLGVASSGAHHGHDGSVARRKHRCADGLFVVLSGMHERMADMVWSGTVLIEPWVGTKGVIRSAVIWAGGKLKAVRRQRQLLRNTNRLRLVCPTVQIRRAHRCQSDDDSRPAYIS